MPDILLRPAEDPIALSPQAAARLLDRGDGDAALLYLALLRRREGTSPRSLAGELRWDRKRIEGAEAVLRELGLLAPAAPPPPPEPANELPVYQPEEVAGTLETDGEFSRLADEVERRLGKKLSTAELSVLLGLYESQGLPADVIYLLVCHCVEKTKERFGPGRSTNFTRIKSEGLAWAKRGIDSQQAAAEYLRKYAESRRALPQLMRALCIEEDRPPSASEEKYLLQWHAWGFGPEAAALAYDRTVFQCHKFKWEYCNGIMQNWHKAGLHTVEEIERGDLPPSARAKRAPGKESGNAWMRKYIQQRKEEG